MTSMYETMVILRPDLDDQGREEVFSKIIKRIEASGGADISAKIWAKERNFCYPIKNRGAEKKMCQQGCYWLLSFSLDTQKLDDLKEAIRLEERILRNLVIKRSK